MAKQKSTDERPLIALRPHQWPPGVRATRIRTFEANRYWGGALEVHFAGTWAQWIAAGLADENMKQYLESGPRRRACDQHGELYWVYKTDSGEQVLIRQIRLSLPDLAEETRRAPKRFERVVAAVERELARIATAAS